jgi:hypothetical protein
MADLTGLGAEKMIRVIWNLNMVGKFTIKHGKIFHVEGA